MAYAQVVIMPTMQGIQYRSPVTLFANSASLVDEGTYHYANVSASFRSGSLTMTEYGIVYGLNPSPTLATATKASSGSGTGTYNNVSYTLSYLRGGSTYYLRAYATVGGNTYYSNELTFTIPPIFYSTGNVQQFTVPPGVTRVTLQCWGAQGGSLNAIGYSAVGGYGAYVRGDLAVIPGQVLYVYVGSRSFNGAGVSGYGGYVEGGGASDVRTILNDLNSRVIVAAGGGGSPLWSGVGGHGGAPNSSGYSGSSSSVPASNCAGGTGATMSAGGAGGYGPYGYGSNGSFGQGGTGGNAGGAGGGGGWYGGGGGGGTQSTYTLPNGSCCYPAGGGGGGGSSYIGGVTNASGSGAANGASNAPALSGKITISW